MRLIDAKFFKLKIGIRQTGNIFLLDADRKSLPAAGWW